MESYIIQRETEAYIGQIAQWLTFCRLPEAAGLTLRLLLLWPQPPHHLLVMWQLQPDLQKTVFLSLSCLNLAVYMHVFSIVLGCLSVEHIYFSLLWGSECWPRSWMVRVLHLRDLMRSIVRLLLKPQTMATFCKFDLQCSYLQTYEEGLFGP